MWLVRCEPTPSDRIKQPQVEPDTTPDGFAEAAGRARSVPEGSDSQHMGGEAPGVSVMERLGGFLA